MEPLQIKLLYPAFLLVQLPEDYKDYFVKRRKKEMLLYSQGEHLPATTVGRISHLDSQH